MRLNVVWWVTACACQDLNVWSLDNIAIYLGGIRGDPRVSVLSAKLSDEPFGTRLGSEAVSVSSADLQIQKYKTRFHSQELMMIQIYK